MSRSVRLRKYESVYKSCLESLASREKTNSPKKKESKREPMKKTERKKRDSSEKKERKKEKKSSDTPKTKLNDYQKFMRSESKKSKYSGMTGGERMKAIGDEWRKKNKK